MAGWQLFAPRVCLAVVSLLLVWADTSDSNVFWQLNSVIQMKMVLWSHSSSAPVRVRKTGFRDTVYINTHTLGDCRKQYGED